MNYSISFPAVGVIHLILFCRERPGTYSDSENTVPTEHTNDQDMWVVYYNVRGHTFTKCILSLYEKATFGSLVHVTSLLKIKNYHIIYLSVGKIFSLL
jgi:hypothetical protein